MENSTKINMPTINADDIIEKAAIGRVKELDTLVNNMADSLSKAASGKNLSKYWKTQDELIKDVIASYKTYNKVSNKDNATELIKVTNALKAIAGVDLSNILPNFDEFTKSLNSAEKKVGSLDSAFDVKGFKEVFDVFKALEQQGLNVQKIFSHFGVSSDVGELQQAVRSLKNEVADLTRRLLDADNANEELRNEFDDFKAGSGIAKKLDELDRLKAEMQNVRNEAILTFNQFLEANKIDRYDWFGNDRFAEYFEQLENGTLTATDAIRQFKSEYAHLLEDSYRSSGNSFGLEQLQAFSEKLDSIFHQVEETAKKINDIISNGVIAKSVQNLSEDTTLSDSQRSIFGNILQDEEALKSIKSLFQKIVEESNNAKNTEIFNTEQFAKVETIFEHIESTLSSIKSVLVDVGEGEELSPLLKMLDNIREAASNIKLGLNIDLGSEISEKLDQNVSQATQRQVTAYQKLLKEMFKAKSNKEMFDFYRNGIPENASNSELVGIYKGIIKRAEDAGKIGNTNIYKKKLGSVYDELKREIKNANAQLSRAEAKRSENGILGDLFGNNTDLSGVIEQLNIIVSKLDEISESAKGFTEAFKDGLNVNASVEEIEKLTNRVKELEDELAKVKTPTVATAPQESNISSGSNPAIEQQNKLQEELKETQAEIIETRSKYQSLLDVAKKQLDNDKGTNYYSGKTTETKAFDNFTFNEQAKRSSHFDVWSKDYEELCSLIDKTEEELESGSIGFDDAIDRMVSAYQKYDTATKIDVGGFDFLDGVENVPSVLSDTEKAVLNENKAIKESEYTLQDYINTYLELKKVKESSLSVNPKITGVTSNGRPIIKDGSDESFKAELMMKDMESEVLQIYGKDLSVLADEHIKASESAKEHAKAENQVTQAIKESSATASTDQTKDAFPSTEATASVEKTTQAIKEENNALEETANKAKQAVSELVKGRDIVSQNWYREKGTVIGKDSNGNDITRDADEFSFVERLKNGQLQTVLATYNEETSKWAEQIIDVRTAFEQVEKAIISADNKITSLEMAKEKTLAAHPGYDATADDNQIAIERKKRDELQNTLNLYGQEKEYVFDIEAANKRIADNQERLNNKKQSQTNLRQTVSEEQFSKDWDAAIAENNKREATRQKSIEQTNRLLNKQQIIIDGIEKAYSKAANPDLDKGVDSQSDLIELANKKAEIQTLLNKLSGQDRNSSNEKEFLQVEKLVAEYKQLAKDKLKANNPSKQELGGQKLDVLLANQVTQYNKLISQSEKYGDATKEITDELKAQRDLIAEQDKNGIYVARSKKADGSEITANDYYKARDNYKIDKSILGSYEDNIKANNQAAKEQNKILREKIELGKQSKGLERKTAESERQSAVNQALKDQLEAWKQIQRIRKEIAGTSNTNIIQQLEQEKKSYQKQFNVATKILKNNSDLYNSEQHINKLKEITLKTTRQIESTQRRQLNGYDKKLSSYNSKTAGYDATIDRFENGGWTSPEYLQNVEAAKKKLKEYEDEISKLKNDPELINKDSLARVKQLGEEFEELTSQIQNMSAAQKGYSLVSGQKELDKIRQILKENSAMSAEAKGKIKAYYREIESGNPSMSLDKIHGEIMKIVNAEAEAGRAGKRMWDVIKEKAWYGAANVIGTYFGVNDIFRYIQQGIGTVRELDTAMTEVRKVSDATEASYAKFQKTIASTAKDIATTNKELLNSSADFLRLGYSLDQASDLAKNATLFVNVGDGVDITEATEDMITAMKAFDIKAEDSIKIVDDYNQIGNLYALSATDIGEAMKRSASALETGNNSFEQSISLITAMNEIVQNSENTGNSLKVLSLRLRGAKAELESMQEETDGLCESTSKLREQIQSLTGVDIMIDDNTFKSTTDIIKEIGAVWDKLSDSSQAATLELIAGKSRANNIAALLKNYQQIDKVMESLGDAEGSAMRENEAIVDSINGRIKVLSATAEEFWKNFISTDLVKNAVSFATSFLNIVTKIIDRFGVLPSLITPIVAILSAKNKNFGKLA